MRRRAALVLGLLNVLLVGCLTGGSARPASWLRRGPLLQAPAGPDVVVLYVALVERPAGDRYLNQELWELADEQGIALERRPVLEANGFRVAQVGGIIPARLQRLLTSERSCINPHRIHLHADHPTTVALGPARAQCRYVVRADGLETPAELERAGCALVVTPALSRDGRTRLRFTPQVQHGETLMMPEPAADPAGIYTWELHERRPTERYDALGWEVELAANEYVLVGGRYDRPDTLGHCCFIDRESGAPVQRLLAIRVGRPAEAVETASAAGEPEADAASGPVPPLALQAACSEVGGH
jgi:hypothetical protein